ncbi:Wzz/FepE/Etk N-terminal domain-containing protein [Microbacterium aurum]
MDLTRFYRMIRKSWVLLLSVTLVGAAVGAAAAFVLPATYTSTERLFIVFDLPANAEASERVQANNYAVQKAFSYVEVVTAPVVLDKVIADLGLNTTAKDLAEDVSASVPLNSAVISIAASAGNPDDAAVLATAISNAFVDYVVNTLESPSTGGAGPVHAVVLQPAIAPTRASGISPLAMIVVGAMLGLLIGLLVCFVLTLRDKRVHSSRDVAELGAEYLAGIPEAPRHSDGRYLAVRDTPSSAEADAFRRLRTRFVLAGERTPGAIAVASSIGGEGASTVAANLALAFAESGAAVALIDGDVRFGRQSDLVGTAAESVDAATAAPGAVAVIGIDPDPTTGGLTHGAFEATMATARRRFDVVIIDSAPVLQADDAQIVADLADRTLLVAASGRVDIAEVAAALDAVRGIGTVAGVILTRLPHRGLDADPAVAVPFHHEVART